MTTTGLAADVWTGKARPGYVHRIANMLAMGIGAFAGGVFVLRLLAWLSLALAAGLAAVVVVGLSTLSRPGQSWRTAAAAG